MVTILIPVVLYNLHNQNWIWYHLLAYIDVDLSDMTRKTNMPPYTIYLYPIYYTWCVQIHGNSRA